MVIEVVAAVAAVAVVAVVVAEVAVEGTIIIIPLTMKKIRIKISLPLMLKL